MRRRTPPLLLATLAGALALAACTEGMAPTPVPPSSPTPPPLPTVTPAPADPDLGRLYQRNGQYEEAIAVFRAVVVAGAEGPERQEAHLSLALTYLDSERYHEALTELDAFLDSGPPPTEASRARFLRARALAALDRPSEAAEEYARYLEAGGPAAPYARLGRAQALALLGRADEAAIEAEAALATDLPPGMDARAALLVARSLEQSGDQAGAGEWYARLARDSESPADQALARWRQADLARRAGDPSWANAAREVMATYPTTTSAVEALEALREAGEPVDGYWAGVVLYRHFRDSEAVDALEENLASPVPSHPAESFYYLAVAQERLGKEDAALEAYQRSLAEDPHGPLADNAAWWRARLLEATGRLEEARLAYGELIVRYSGSLWAPEARFRRGLVFYKQAQFDEAAETWRRSMNSQQSPEEQGRILLWLAKVAMKRGDDRAAEDYLQRLSALPESGYYVFRANTLLTGDVLEEKKVDITINPPDWSRADAWAAALNVAGAVPFDPASDPRWIRASELLALGLHDESRAEFEAVLLAHSSYPIRLYKLARAFDALSQTHLAARAATLLLERLSPTVAESAPPEVWRLAYPAGFASLVETASRREGLPAELLLALIRQESFFDPRAGSRAGALGLTQVIPSTGEAIADDLGVEGEFEEKELLRPSVSISFGARYLKRQLQQFDGNVVEALAAYNGGPGNVLRWRNAAQGDPDLLLEEIDLPETRAYVRLVSENLARYRQLYAAP